MELDSTPEISDLSISFEKKSLGFRTMNNVKLNSVNLDIEKGEQKFLIPLIKRVEKKVRAFRNIGEYLSWAQETGLESANKDLFIGEAQKVIFKNELKNLTTLNKLKNPYVPRVVKADKSGLSYVMEFVFGADGEPKRADINLSTKLVVLNQTLEAVLSTVQAGFVNLEVAPKNRIVKVDYKTGKPSGVILLDWGLSFPIDKDGQIEIDVGLLRKARVRIEKDEGGEGLIPPEARVKKGKVKINGEKALIWSLAYRLIYNYFNNEQITNHREFFLKCIDQNPNLRPKLSEFIKFYKSLPMAESEIQSWISSKDLEKMQKMIGRQDSEIVLPENKLNKVLDQLNK